jgi:gamma-butyrobetaine dioxygenase
MGNIRRPSANPSAELEFPMAVPRLDLREEALVVSFADNDSVTYPAIWLRDNCPTGLHPDTHERVLDLLSLDQAPKLNEALIEGPVVRLHYADGHVSRIPLALLEAHRPGRIWADPAAIAPELWRSDLGLSGIPRFAADAVLESDAALEAWMQDTARLGLSIITDLADSIDAGMAVAKRIGFLRQTNFGDVFEVVSLPKPNNLAYTAIALPLHTDLPNQEVPPGFQFLHCLANAAKGGESIFADGFAIAEDLRSLDPAAFELLSTVPIPFRFYDKDFDIRVREPVIIRDRAGAVTELRYNAHIAGIFDMPAEVMPAYYRAYRALMTLTRDARYRLTFMLQPGEMVVFDNRRTLHGREAFDPATGSRHLHGCYVDRGEFLSRLRVLARGPDG